MYIFALSTTKGVKSILIRLTLAVSLSGIAATNGPDRQTPATDPAIVEVNTLCRLAEAKLFTYPDSAFIIA